MRTALVAGVALGVAYTMSPLTVICLPLVIATCAWAARDLPAGERRWLVALVAVAVTIRLLAISFLLLSADASRPFEVLFGDELFFKNRSLWMRNIGLGVPISPADLIYAFEDVGLTSYLELLAFLQALVGRAPYGIHVFNSACYVTASLLMFRLVRRSLGAVAAYTGLAILLFLPSLFMWSISALKEPLFVLVAAIELVCALQAARAVNWRWRAAWLVGVVAAAAGLESIRRGGSLVALLGVGAGYVAGFVWPRPKLRLAAVTLLPLVAAATLSLPPVQERALAAMRTGALYHSGHVGSPGYSYHALSGDYYIDGPRIFTMPARDAMQFVVRSLVAYVTEPVPWRIESAALLAYLPEQMTWYGFLVLAVAGLKLGLKIDPMATMVLAAHAAAAAVIVAVSGGNIGTLIRHRGLVMPYLAWLVGLGLYQVVGAVTRPSAAAPVGGLHAHDHL